MMQDRKSQSEVLFGNHLSDRVSMRFNASPFEPIPGVSGAGVPSGLFLNEEAFSKHILLLGGIGTGKTNTMYHLVDRVEKQLSADDVMVIFDTKGDFYDKFYHPGDVVISHDVTELAFVYNFTEDRIWNPETLKYEIVVEGDWEDASQDITITNYSDVPVNVTPSYSTPAVEGVTVTLSAALELASAYDNNLAEAGTAKTGVISVTLGGDPVADLENATLLTTVTLAITDAR